jgi:YegS/Rv2252/BmrU family lipid kinase
MQHAYFIINPAAGAGRTVKQWPMISQYINDLGIKFETNMTDSPGHAINLAYDAVKQGYKYIVAVGGDGTVSEIANGIYKANALNEVKLGIVSTGTGADYIRTVGIPRNFEDACKRLASSEIKKVDLGMIECSKDGKTEKRLFVNFAGIGFDAEIVKATTQKYKAMGKVSAYLLGLFTTLVSYQNKEVDIIVGDTSEKKRICTVIMGNGNYGGGGMYTTPEAIIDDGLLDILIIGDLSKPDLLNSLPMIYKGTHLKHPKVFLKKAKEVTIKPAIEMSIQADGDIVGESPATFSIIEQKLCLVV